MAEPATLEASTASPPPVAETGQRGPEAATPAPRPGEQVLSEPEGTAAQKVSETLRDEKPDKLGTTMSSDELEDILEEIATLDDAEVQRELQGMLDHTDLGEPAEETTQTRQTEEQHTKPIQNVELPQQPLPTEAASPSPAPETPADSVNEASETTTTDATLEVDDTDDEYSVPTPDAYQKTVDELQKAMIEEMSRYGGADEATKAMLDIIQLDLSHIQQASGLGLEQLRDSVKQIISTRVDELKKASTDTDSDVNTILIQSDVLRRLKELQTVIRPPEDHPPQTPHTEASGDPDHDASNDTATSEAASEAVNGESIPNPDSKEALYNKILADVLRASEGRTLVHTDMPAHDGRPLVRRGEPDYGVNSGFQTLGDRADSEYNGVAVNARNNRFNIPSDKVAIESVFTKHLQEPVYEDQQVETREGFFGRKVTTRTEQVKVGEQDVTMRNPITGEDEPAVEFVYQFKSNGPKVDHVYPTNSGRPGNMLVVNIQLPESIAQQLVTAAKENPDVARQLAKKLTVSDRTGITQHDWEVGNTDQGKHFKVEPPYDTLPKDWTMGFYDEDTKTETHVPTAKQPDGESTEDTNSEQGSDNDERQAASTDQDDTAQEQNGEEADGEEKDEAATEKSAFDKANDMLDTAIADAIDELKANGTSDEDITDMQNGNKVTGNSKEFFLIDLIQAKGYAFRGQKSLASNLSSTIEMRSSELANVTADISIAPNDATRDHLQATADALQSELKILQDIQNELQPEQQNGDGQESAENTPPPDTDQNGETDSSDAEQQPDKKDFDTVKAEINARYDGLVDQAVQSGDIPQDVIDKIQSGQELNGKTLAEQFIIDMRLIKSASEQSPSQTTDTLNALIASRQHKIDDLLDKRTPFDPENIIDKNINALNAELAELKRFQQDVENSQQPDADTEQSADSDTSETGENTPDIRDQIDSNYNDSRDRVIADGGDPDAVIAKDDVLKDSEYQPGDFTEAELAFTDWNELKKHLDAGNNEDLLSSLDSIIDERNAQMDRLAEEFKTTGEMPDGMQGLAAELVKFKKVKDDLDKSNAEQQPVTKDFDTVKGEISARYDQLVDQALQSGDTPQSIMDKIQSGQQVAGRTVAEQFIIDMKFIKDATDASPAQTLFALNMLISSRENQINDMDDGLDDLQVDPRAVIEKSIADLKAEVAELKQFQQDVEASLQPDTDDTEADNDTDPDTENERSNDLSAELNAMLKTNYDHAKQQLESRGGAPDQVLATLATTDIASRSVYEQGFVEWQAIQSLADSVDKKALRDHVQNMLNGKAARLADLAAQNSDPAAISAEYAILSVQIMEMQNFQDKLQEEITAEDPADTGQQAEPTTEQTSQTFEQTMKQLEKTHGKDFADAMRAKYNDLMKEMSQAESSGDTARLRKTKTALWWILAILGGIVALPFAAAGAGVYAAGQMGGRN